MDTVSIASRDNKTRATFVPERGGAASSIIMPSPHGDRELLFLEEAFWDRDSYFLPGGAPFCFPVCGRLHRDEIAGEYLYQGQRYNMGIHGFAWKKAWQVSAHKQNSVTLSLKDDEQTREMYPFSFELSIAYTISNAALKAQLSVKNTGDSNMPYYAGFHPYFATPPGSQKAKVKLDMKSSHRYQYNSMLTDVMGQLPPLAFPCSVANPTINESLNILKGDNAFTLHYPEGERLTMQVLPKGDHTFPFTQIYTRDKDPFVCVEQWMSHPNAMNTMNAVRWLAPGAKDRTAMNLSWGNYE
jgi:galactose mutarotase-like enzyme